MKKQKVMICDLYWYEVKEVNSKCHSPNKPMMVGHVYGVNRLAENETIVWDRIVNDLVWWTRQKFLFKSKKGDIQKDVIDKIMKLKKVQE